MEILVPLPSAAIRREFHYGVVQRNTIRLDQPYP